MAKETKFVITPEFTMDFPCLIKERVDKETKQPVGFDVTMIFKNVEVKPLIALMREAAAEKFGKDIPEKFIWPLQRPDAERVKKYPHYEGTVFAKAKSKYKPTVINGKKQEITDEKELYSGAKGLAKVSAKAWEHKGKKGVTFYLAALQKTGDGEKLFKGTDHTEAFAQLEDAGMEMDLNDLGGLSVEDNDMFSL